MRISVFGLGYVGAVSAACFARNGHEIIGVDTNLSKVQSFNAGRAPVVESGLDELMADGVNSGKIRATSSVEDAIRNSEVSIVCVGTPSRANGSLNLDAVETVCVPNREGDRGQGERPSHCATLDRAAGYGARHRAAGARALFGPAAPASISPSSIIPSSCAKEARSRISISRP